MDCGVRALVVPLAFNEDDRLEGVSARETDLGEERLSRAALQRAEFELFGRVPRNYKLNRAVAAAVPAEFRVVIQSVTS